MEGLQCDGSFGGSKRSSSEAGKGERQRLPGTLFPLLSIGGAERVRASL